MYPEPTEPPGPQPAARIAPQQVEDQPDAVVARWFARIEAADKAMKPFRGYVQRVQRFLAIERNAGETTPSKTRKLGIAWANGEILKPSTFARPPQCVVSVRYELPSGPMRNMLTTAALVLEKAVNTNADRVDAFDELLKVRDDFVQYARGVAWKRYVPTIEDVEPPPPGYGMGATPTIEGLPPDAAPPEPRQRLVDEQVVTEWVPWDKFGHGFARTWREVPFIWRVVDMTKSMVEKRFGPDVAGQLTYGEPKRGGHDGQSEPSETTEVYEVWDKDGRQCLWLSKSSLKPLDVGEPPFDLKGFYPTPRPAYGTLLDRSLIPKPDIMFYEDQLREINDLTKRIGALQNALRVKGFYPGGASSEGAKAIESAILASDDRAIMVPVPGWAAMSEKANFGMMWLPVDTVVQVLRECITTRKELIANVFEITGISDIMRGTSAASETLGAQQLKTQFGSVRVREKQQEMARYARDSCALDAEIIAEHFEPDTIAKLTGMQFDETVIGLLRDDKLRSFAIDVETDSTIAADEMAEKSRRVEMVKVVGEFITSTLPAVQAMPALAPMAGEMLKFLLQPFRAGRQLEQAVDQAIAGVMQQIQQAAAAPKPPDPRMLAVEAKAKNDQERLQLDAATTSAELQHDAQMKREERAAKALEAQRERTAAMFHLPAAPTVQ